MVCTRLVSCLTKLHVRVTVVAVADKSRANACWISRLHFTSASSSAPPMPIGETLVVDCARSAKSPLLISYPDWYSDSNRSTRIAWLESLLLGVRFVCRVVVTSDICADARADDNCKRQSKLGSVSADPSADGERPRGMTASGVSWNYDDRGDQRNGKAEPRRYRDITCTTVVLRTVTYIDQCVGTCTDDRRRAEGMQRL